LAWFGVADAEGGPLGAVVGPFAGGEEAGEEAVVGVVE